jgi:phytoene dehydrogenase-like protein
VDGLLSLTNPVGSVADKINVGVFRLKSLLGTWDELLQRPETTIEARLRKEGFSESIIDQFFRPFLGGIFFDRSLGTSSRLFEFVMRTLALGANCFPAKGMGEVSEQLAARLPAGAVLLNTPVQRVLPAGGAGEA